ncbi:MAG: hypothetical protein CMG75_07380 [Candidatus Marinimicrobia bacterium]|nr:hypothetical protein [Candidatus Neomarinimicrobiota bacterium]
MALPIKKRRKNLGLTQKELASNLGVSLPSIVNWENGKIAPRGKNLEKIEKFLSRKSSVSKKKKSARPKGQVGRPKKVVVATKTKKRGRPKVKVLSPKKEIAISRQLSRVAKDLGFSNVDDMVKTIIRKHKIGKLDL